MTPISRGLEISRTENELLVYCARTVLSAEAAGQIRLLAAQNLDWEYLFRSAGYHKLAPLVCLHLKNTVAEIIPPYAQEYIRNYFLKNISRNLSLSGELLKILQIFNAQGIFAVPYKGPVLAETVYGNLALREFVDLDILVRKSDVLVARDLLIKRGYQPFFQLAESQEEAFLNYQCEHVLSDQSRDWMVEIQWRIVPEYFSFRFDYESLWQRLEPAAFCNRQIKSFSAEDTLLILCVHGSKHLWAKLGWVCDVAEAVRHFQIQQLNWERLEERAASSGSQRMLHLGLFLAHDLLSAELPEDIRQKVCSDAAVKTLAKQVYSRLWVEDENAPGFFGSSLFHLRAKERWRDRLQFCFRVLTTTTIEDWPSDEDFSAFPFAIQARRAIRLLRKYLPQLFRLLFSR